MDLLFGPFQPRISAYAGISALVADSSIARASGACMDLGHTGLPMIGRRGVLRRGEERLLGGGGLLVPRRGAPLQPGAGCASHVQLSQWAAGRPRRAGEELLVRAAQDAEKHLLAARRTAPARKTQLRLAQASRSGPLRDAGLPGRVVQASP